MKERGMIFNEYQIRALLDGSMTQTRRIMKPQPTPCEYVDERGRARGGHHWPSNIFQTMLHVEGELQNGDGGWKGLVGDACPFGDVADRIWVRETYGDCGVRLVYRADSDDGAACMVKRWTPSIHMPRRDSRFTLEITGVRVERLRDADDSSLLDDLGAMLEYDDTPAGRAFNHAEHYAIAGVPVGMCPEMHGFKAWWDKTNGAGSFDANPWVWVIEFKRVEGGAA